MNPCKHRHTAKQQINLMVVFGMLFVFTHQVQAQCLPAKIPFNQGEVVDYDIYFKWGFLMPRAGQGRMSYTNSSDHEGATSKYQLTFQTSKFFDAIYKMRDTLDCFYDRNNALLFSSKRTDEGGRYSTDELTFAYKGDGTMVRSRRYTPERLKIDTVLTVASGCASDMLGAVFWFRTLDWKDMRVGDHYSSTVAIGRDLVKISFRYQGQSIVERDDAKYKTHYFLIDIFDEAFEQNKSAAELWVGDDENHIPIKIRAKLKIGYAEVHYKSSSNLKVPLMCRVEIKR